MAENYLKRAEATMTNATDASCVETASEQQGGAATTYHGDY